MKNIDAEYLLTSFQDKSEESTHEYKSAQIKIANYGFCERGVGGDTVKVYTPQLALIFYSTELPAKNRDTQKETTIKGTEYLKTYIEAYKEGVKYFENEFKVSPNIIFDKENAERYVNTIKSNFFDNWHKRNIDKSPIKGWVSIKGKYFLILSHAVVEKMGFYSGIVNRVEQLISDYTQQFSTFYVHEPQQSTKETKSIDSKEPENKYPKIFKNSYAYQMFIELKKLTVDKNPLADYGFIYYKLIDKKIGAINDNITHPKFIDFLRKEFDVDITAKKFTFKNQQNKQQAYNTTLEKYKANIID